MIADDDTDLIEGFDPIIDRYYNPLVGSRKYYLPLEHIEISNIHNKERTWYKKSENSKKRKDTRGIGDVFLENLIKIDEPSNIQTLVSINELKIQNSTRFKKDYVLTHIKDSKNDITHFNVYAVSYENITYVIVLIMKCNLSIPIITYNETTDDPFYVINTVYEYNLGRSRTPFQKNTQSIVVNPKKRFIKKINPEIYPRLDLEFNLDIDLDFNNGTILIGVPQDLIELEILIKNKQYISDATHCQLLQTVNYLTMF